MEKKPVGSAGGLQRLPIAENPIIESPSRWMVTTSCLLIHPETIATEFRKPSKNTPLPATEPEMVLIRQVVPEKRHSVGLV